MLTLLIDEEEENDCDDIECIQLLLQYGTDVNILNKLGNNVFTYINNNKDENEGEGSELYKLCMQYKDINDRDLLAVKPLLRFGRLRVYVCM